MGVVTSLEASSVETPFGDLAGLLLAICFGGGYKSVGGRAEKGVAYLTPRRLLFCWWSGVITRLLFACLQRSAAPGTAWQSPLRCGTTFEGRR